MNKRWEITPWTADWDRQYAIESRILQDIFRDERIEIHHVGSTSVPSIGYAKPIVDILIIVEDIGAVSRFNERMTNAGYRVRGENGIPNRRYFTKGDFPRTHHVHIYQKGDPRVRTYLDFKAYMIAHPEEAENYGMLKRDILQAHSVDAYQREKEKRMGKWVEEALRWGERGK